MGWRRLARLAGIDTTRYLTATGTTVGSNVDWQTLGSGGLNAQLWEMIETLAPEPPSLSDRLDILVSTAEDCLGFNLAQCAEYFDVANPHFAWCAWFVRMCGRKAGLDFGSSNLASGLRGLEGNFTYSNTGISVGDLAFIDPQRESTIRHIGIIVEITDTKVYTVEGNMSGHGNPDISIVKRGQYNRSDGYSNYSFGQIVKFGKNS